MARNSKGDWVWRVECPTDEGPKLLEFGICGNAWKARRQGRRFMLEAWIARNGRRSPRLKEEWR